MYYKCSKYISDSAYDCLDSTLTDWLSHKKWLHYSTGRRNMCLIYVPPILALIQFNMASLNHCLNQFVNLFWFLSTLVSPTIIRPFNASNFSEPSDPYWPFFITSFYALMLTCTNLAPQLQHTSTLCMLTYFDSIFPCILISHYTNARLVCFSPNIKFTIMTKTYHCPLLHKTGNLFQNYSLIQPPNPASFDQASNTMHCRSL